MHGLGINPANGDLCAASHFGLFRLPDDGKAERVGRLVQDTMGFTVVGADRFLPAAISISTTRGCGSPGVRLCSGS